jgi:3-hydroxyacyl-[acyl-carrier-protein] dehydratase
LEDGREFGLDFQVAFFFMNSAASQAGFCPSNFQAHALAGEHPTRRKSSVQYNLRLTWCSMDDGIPTAMEAPTAEPRTILDINDIIRILPHRYPFLLIDRVIELTRKERIVALKNVTANEPFFQGHFPNMPIMPGVLIVEAIAQAGGALLLTEVHDREDKLMVFTGIERARFRRPVVPGDQLRIEVDVKAWRMTAVRMAGRAFVGDKRAAEATVTCQLIPRERGSASDGSGAPTLRT